VSLSTSSRPRLLGMALLAVVFAAGALAGAAFYRVAEARPGEEGARDERCERPHGRKGLLVDQVSPTPEQRVRIDSILERRRGQMDAFWSGEGQRLRTIVDSTRGEIRAVLTPAQRAEYDRLLEERAARHREGERDRERTSAGGG